MADEVAPIRFPVPVFDLAFHPSARVLAAALIDGSLELHSYVTDEDSAHAASAASAGRVPTTSVTRMLRAKPHADSVRALRFAPDGASLLSASSDRSVARLDGRGVVTWQRRDAHKSALNALVPLAADGALFATGDDDGLVRLWDARAPPTAVAPVSIEGFTDVITSLTFDAARGALLATSGDGSLGLIDLRKARLTAHSEQNEDELLSAAVLKGGSVVVTGTQEGVLLVWDWGKWTWGEEEEA
jgi:WD repeat-containing protein 55